MSAEAPVGRDSSGVGFFNEADRALHREILTPQNDLDQWRARVWYYVGNLHLGMPVEEALAAATESVGEWETRRGEHVAW